MLRSCFHCKAENADKLCGSCKIARYCSAECQKRHWRKHRSLCLACSNWHDFSVGAADFVTNKIRSRPLADHTSLLKFASGFIDNISPLFSKEGASHEPLLADMERRRRQFEECSREVNRVVAETAVQQPVCRVCLESACKPFHMGCACRGENGYICIECAIGFHSARAHSDEDVSSLFVCDICKTARSASNRAILISQILPVTCENERQLAFLNKNLPIDYWYNLYYAHGDLLTSRSKENTVKDLLVAHEASLPAIDRWNTRSLNREKFQELERFVYSRQSGHCHAMAHHLHNMKTALLQLRLLNNCARSMHNPNRLRSAVSLIKMINSDTLKAMQSDLRLLFEGSLWFKCALLPVFWAAVHLYRATALVCSYLYRISNCRKRAAEPAWSFEEFTAIVAEAEASNSLTQAESNALRLLSEEWDESRIRMHVALMGQDPGDLLMPAISKNIFSFVETADSDTGRFLSVSI